TSSPFFVDDLIDRLVTSAIRSLVCSAAPFTWTVKPHDDWLPAGSCAVLVTLVVPIAKTFPDAGVDEIVAEQLSPATGAKITAAPAGPVAATVIGDGHAMSGASTSFTVTVKLQVDEAFGNEGLTVCELT